MREIRHRVVAVPADQRIGRDGMRAGFRHHDDVAIRRLPAQPFAGHRPGRARPILHYHPRAGAELRGDAARQ